jgi:cell wall-associated NlpC family hydrolase
MDARCREHDGDGAPRRRSTRATATAAFLLAAGLPVLAVATPARAATEPASRWYAAPAPPAPSVPGASGAAGLPFRPPPPRISPLAARLESESAAVEALSERLVEERETLRQLTDATAAAGALAAAASARYGESRGRVDAWARSAYVRLAETGSTAPGPFAALASTPSGGTDDAGPLVTELEDAAGALAASGAAYDWARRAADRAGAAVTALDAEHTRRSAALDALRSRHKAELDAARVVTDRYNDALSRRYLGDLQLTAGESALAVRRAVWFALAQLGKPYVWGAEGPDTYDCSGLVQAAYAAAGVALPRTARPQYLATVPVPVSAMVPGDLLFFGTDPRNWNSIHHVGMYLGRGLMVHAPTSGDVVRVAPIWWAEFFGATRVVAARNGAGEPITVPVTGLPGAPAARPVRVPARPARPTPVSPTRPVPGDHRTPPAPGAPPSPPAGPPATAPDPAPPQCPPPGLTLTIGPLRITLGADVRDDSTSASCPPPSTP